MWHTMHWLVGIARVSSCLIGWPDSFFGMVGSICALRPWLPYAAYVPECAGDRSFA
jgi:hypothetical protein